MLTDKSYLRIPIGLGRDRANQVIETGQAMDDAIVIRPVTAEEVNARLKNAQLLLDVIVFLIESGFFEGKVNELQIYINQDFTSAYYIEDNKALIIYTNKSSLKDDLLINIVSALPDADLAKILELREQQLSRVKQEWDKSIGAGDANIFEMSAAETHNSYVAALLRARLEKFRLVLPETVITQISDVINNLLGGEIENYRLEADHVIGTALQYVNLLGMRKRPLEACLVNIENISFTPDVFKRILLDVVCPILKYAGYAEQGVLLKDFIQRDQITFSIETVEKSSFYNPRKSAHDI